MATEKKIMVVLTGAGISAESGIPTFRDAGGLWEGYDVHTVASPEGWRKNPDLVLKFYNQRRANLLTVKPNRAHTLLAELQKYYHVLIITQNVDDLHEQGGSQYVMHLHGELLKARSTDYPALIYDWRKDINMGDLCEKGSQLRPHIVWFGEEVPLIADAAEAAAAADIFVVVGTSMQVYPAASLIQYVPTLVPKYYIDKNPAQIDGVANLKIIPKVASEGMADFIQNELKINL